MIRYAIEPQNDPKGDGVWEKCNPADAVEWAVYAEDEGDLLIATFVTEMEAKAFVEKNVWKALDKTRPLTK